MTRLLRVELTRLRKRRAVLVLLLAALVGPALILGGIVWDTRPVSAQDLARAEEQIDRELASSGYQEMIEDCTARPRQWGIGAERDSDRARRACIRQNRPRVEWYVGRAQLRPAQQQVTGYFVIGLVTALVMLAATTFIGHDWNSGSISNQLLFEPRRQRVFWAKGLAVVLMALLSTALALAVFWGGLAVVADARGIDVPGTLWRTVAVVGGRGIVFAMAATLGAYAVTMLFRSTVVTLGLMFAAVVVGSIVISLLPYADAQRFQLPANLLAWLTGEARYPREVASACYDSLGGGRQQPPAGLDCRQSGLITLWDAAAYYGAMVVAGVGAAAASFQRRDVP